MLATAFVLGTVYFRRKIRFVKSVLASLIHESQNEEALIELVSAEGREASEELEALS